MTVDSCWVMDQYNLAEPDVRIVDWDIDESGAYPTVQAIIMCYNGTYEVTGRMERMDISTGSVLEASLDFYDSNGLVSMILSASHSGILQILTITQVGTGCESWFMIQSTSIQTAFSTMIPHMM